MAKPKQTSSSTTEKRFRLIKEWMRDDPELKRQVRAEVKMTKEEKLEAVKALLNDPSLSQESNTEIARRCDVSKSFVGDVREELTGKRAPEAVKATRGGSKYIFSTSANVARARPMAKAKNPVGRPPKKDNEQFLDAATAAAKEVYRPGRHMKSSELVNRLAVKGVHMTSSGFRKRISRLTKKKYEDWLADAVANAGSSR
jgi:hypothetical protein